MGRASLRIVFYDTRLVVVSWLVSRISLSPQQNILVLKKVVDPQFSSASMVARSKLLMFYIPRKEQLRRNEDYARVGVFVMSMLSYEVGLCSTLRFSQAEIP